MEHEAGLVTWIVTVEERKIEVIDAVAAELGSQGLHVQSILRSLGQVCGQGSSDCRARLAAVDGVQSVDAEREFRLPPPHNDIQ